MVHQCNMCVCRVILHLVCTSNGAVSIRIYVKLISTSSANIARSTGASAFMSRQHHIMYVHLVGQPYINIYVVLIITYLQHLYLLG